MLTMLPTLLHIMTTVTTLRPLHHAAPQLPRAALIRMDINDAFKAIADEASSEATANQTQAAPVARGLTKPAINEAGKPVTDADRARAYQEMVQRAEDIKEGRIAPPESKPLVEVDMPVMDYEMPWSKWARERREQQSAEPLSPNWKLKEPITPPWVKWIREKKTEEAAEAAQSFSFVEDASDDDGAADMPAAPAADAPAAAPAPSDASDAAQKIAALEAEVARLQKEQKIAALEAELARIREEQQRGEDGKEA